MSVFSQENEYEDRVFKNLEAHDEIISGKEFRDCTFQQCDFAGVQFLNCKFIACTFQHCDLSLAKVNGATFNNVTFEHCKAIGINWTDAHWMPGFSQLDFDDCGINYSFFTGMELRKIKIVGCVAKEVNFEDADLTEANLQKTDFSGSRFVNTNLTKADFTGAKNYTIDVTLNTIKKAKFSLPEAIALLRSLDIILNNSEENES